MVVRHPRLPPPGARRRGPRPARPDGARDVRRPHPRARRAPRRAPGRDHPRGARARVPVRLGIGLGRGRAEDVPAGAAGAPQRLLTVRGGYHGDTFGAMSVCDPVGGMHSPVHAARCRGRCSRRDLRAGSTTPTPPSSSELVDPARRRARGGDRGAGRAGRGRHVVLRPAGPARCCATLCDQHGLLLVLDEIATGFGRTGDAVRLRARGRDARRHVRGQGADRRLRDAGRDALHRRCRGLAGGRSADARPHLHGQPAGLLAWRWPRPSSSPRANGATQVRAIEARACGRASSRPASSRAWPTCACSARSG